MPRVTNSLGFTCMLDPLRTGIPGAVEYCHRAGIRVLMVTGDHATTARVIAAKVGIEAERGLTGAEIAELSNAELTERLRDIAVFARIAPAQKHRICTLLQGDGEVVAVTGDGVNDASALKAAHIGGRCSVLPDIPHRASNGRTRNRCGEDAGGDRDLPA